MAERFNYQPNVTYDKRRIKEHGPDKWVLIIEIWDYIPNDTADQYEKKLIHQIAVNSEQEPQIEGVDFT